jgi:hypothetical protein
MRSTEVRELLELHTRAASLGEIAAWRLWVTAPSSFVNFATIALRRTQGSWCSTLRPGASQTK